LISSLNRPPRTRSGKPGFRLRRGTKRLSGSDRRRSASRLAHLFDPYLAVHSSRIEPLPHQITAVYGEMRGGVSGSGVSWSRSGVGLVNRIGAILATLGADDYNPLLQSRRRRLTELRTGLGDPIPPNALAKIVRLLTRLELVLALSIGRSWHGYDQLSHSVMWKAATGEIIAR
jgi:hypothetical protein